MPDDPDLTPLGRRIAQEAASRPLTFAEFMTAALYDPEHGYYAKGPDIGVEGDFYTSANLPGFAEALAEGVRDAWERLDRPDPFAVVELGAGTGDLAVALKTALSDLPLRYVCVEPSAGLRERQRARGLLSVGDLTMAGRLDRALVLGNEVLDALPVHRVRATEDSGLEEIYVTYRPGRGFAEEAGPLSTPAIDQWFGDVELVPGRVYEASLTFGGLARALYRSMGSGFVLFIDYGDERPRIHADERGAGTLRAFHRHRLSDDVFARVGEQDLTASVDFTAFRREAEFAGFEVAGYATQGEFLVNLGIVDHHARLAAEDPLLALKTKTLFVPGGMGDAFKVVALAKNVPTNVLKGFHPAFR